MGGTNWTRLMWEWAEKVLQVSKSSDSINYSDWLTDNVINMLVWLDVKPLRLLQHIELLLWFVSIRTRHVWKYNRLSGKLTDSQTWKSFHASSTPFQIFHLCRCYHMTGVTQWQLRKTIRCSWKPRRKRKNTSQWNNSHRRYICWWVNDVTFTRKKS